MITHHISVVLLLASTLFSANGETESELHPTSEAPRDDSDVWLVVVLCALICFAMRHANDFYAGETVTLVEEGVWSGRFRHKVEYRILTSIEKDFEEMYEQLKDKEEVRIHAEHPDEP
ncbi:hypothetical protein Aduo_019373 [Ancylostoma duodenale]